MQSVSTPNYVTTEDHEIHTGFRGVKVLPAGSFVRPIEQVYVPKHILEANTWVNKDTHCYCYTHYGIVVLPKEGMRKV